MIWMEPIESEPIRSEQTCKSHAIPESLCDNIRTCVWTNGEWADRTWADKECADEEWADREWRNIIYKYIHMWLTWANDMVEPSGGGLESQKNKYRHKATSGFGRMRIPLGSFWGWSLFHAVQIKVQQAALSWGRNEMNSAQSPVSGLALFPKVRKPSSRHKATSRFGRMEFPLGSSGVWSLFRTVQIKVQQAPLSWRPQWNELCTVTSFCRSGPLFYKETLTTAALWLCRSTLMRTTRVSLWSRLTL